MATAFTQLHDKALAACTAAALCPTMDLLAYATSDGTVHVMVRAHTPQLLQRAGTGTNSLGVAAAARALISELLR
jgi:hypothetical protein